MVEIFTNENIGQHVAAHVWDIATHISPIDQEVQKFLRKTSNEDPVYDFKRFLQLITAQKLISEKPSNDMPSSNK